jgi:hypothetical protein
MDRRAEELDPARLTVYRLGRDKRTSARREGLEVV